MCIDKVLSDIIAIKNGFQHILDGADGILSTYSKNSALNLLLNCLSTKPIKPECWQQRYWEDWQQRMMMPFIF